MRKRITGISILQSSKIIVALYVLIGCIYAVPGIFMLVFGGTENKIAGALLLFMPIIMGVLGFVFFAFSAWVYNMLAKVLGGFEFDVEDVGE